MYGRVQKFDDLDKQILLSCGDGVAAWRDELHWGTYFGPDVCTNVLSHGSVAGK